MAKTSFSFLSSSDLASQSAFIYVIVETNLKVLYIGQTNSTHGALGRLSQHLSNDYRCNTFKQRVERVCGAKVLNLNYSYKDIYLFAQPLMPYKAFYSKASDYRESVEYVLQYLIINMCSNQSSHFSVISNVRANGYIKENIVVEEADRLFNAFKEWFVATNL